MSHSCDPSVIIVRNRQRSSVGDTTELEVSIKTHGQIQAIVVRRDGTDKVLMVGERRLRACENLGIEVKYEFWEDLDEFAAAEVELEENIKRLDLPWRDHVKAIGTLHRMRLETDSTWTTLKSAERHGLTYQTIRLVLMVFKNIDSPIIRDANGFVQAFRILQVHAARRAAAIVGEISKAGTEIFEEGPGGEVDEHGNDPGPGNNLSIPDGPVLSGGPDGVGYSRPTASIQGSEPATVASSNPVRSSCDSVRNVSPESGPGIVQGDFLKWPAEYSGPKFNLIHCDFPYDVAYDSYAKSTSSTGEDYDTKDFWTLLDTFTANLDKFCSYSAHVVFWFSMEFYERTRVALESTDLYVHRHPLIWHKTDNTGIIPGRDNQFPRRIYETAFLCSRGKRPLVKSLANIYGSPAPTIRIHPSQKSEPMLRHFFSMLVDETTDVFDPTAGSGAALRAAEDCGARSIFGLELDPKYAEAGEGLIRSTRLLRKASK